VDLLPAVAQRGWVFLTQDANIRYRPAEMAALREIREETGIEGAIDSDLGSIEYWFFSREDKVRIHKVVHFFLVRFVSGDTSRHDHEVAEAAWFDLEGALDRMTYPNERQIVRKAMALLDP